MNSRFSARFNLARGVLSSRILPVTAGTCLLVAANPAQAAGTDADRAMRAERHAQRVSDASRFDRRPSDAIRDNHRDQLDVTRLTGRTAGGTMFMPGQFSTFRTTRPEVSNRSTYLNNAGRNRSIHSGVSLNLSSNVANITVGEKLLGDSQITIETGGLTKQIATGSLVTAAEYAALNQKLSTGSQALELDSSGAATGGSLDINLVSDGGRTIKTSELVIPENVQVSGDFSRRADGVRVTNDLVNYGSLVAESSRRGTAIIAARDINNNEGAAISSIGADLNLALRADRDFNNDGSITSDGNLELSAGSSLNLGSSSNVQAARSVSLNTPVLNNQGEVTATGASVYITSPTDADLIVNNSGGTIRALNGDINLATTTGANIKTDTVMTGGDWFSNQLNIVSGDGAVNGSVGDVTGMVNITGGSVQFDAGGETTIMGQMNVSGDPLLSAAGNLIIAANQNTNGAPLSIIAGGSISVTPGVTTINTTPSAGSANGGAILIVAGAAFTTPSDLEITGGTAGGGNVDLTGITTFQSNATGAFTAGSIRILAFPGASNGAIIIPATTTISAAAQLASGSNGNIVIGGGAATGNAVSMGNVSNSVGNGVGGDVIITASVPTVTTTVVIETAAAPNQGQVLSGSFGFGGTTAGNVVVGDVTAPAADISIASGGSVSAGSISSAGLSATQSGGIVAITSGGIGALSVGSVNASAALDAGSVFLTGSGNGTFSVGDIQARSNINGSGGAVQLTANSNGTMVVGEIDSSGGFSSGNGGSILIDNNGTGGITLQGTSYLSDSPAGFAGFINVDAGTGTVALGLPSGVSMDASGGIFNGSITVTSQNLLTNGRSFSAVTNGGGGIGSITLNIDGASGIVTSGGDILLQARTSISVNVSSNIIDTTGTLDSGSVTIQAGGAITLGNTGNANVDTSASDPSGDGGTVVITTASTLSMGNIDASAGTGASAVGGNVFITTSGVSTVGTIQTNAVNGFAGSIAANFNSVVPVQIPFYSANGDTDGDIAIGNPGSGGLTLSGSLIGANVSVFAGSGSSIDLQNFSVLGSSSISLSTNGTISQSGAGQLVTPSLTLEYSSGAPVLNGVVGSLTVDALGLPLTLNSSGNLSVLSVNNSDLSLTSSNGNITFTQDYSGFNSLSLSAPIGTVFLQSNLTTAGTISFTGNVSQTSGIITTTGAGLNLTLAPVQFAGFPSANNINQFTSTGAGLINLNNGANALNVLSIGATQALILSTSNVNGISLLNPITTTGTIELTTPRLFTDEAINAAYIYVYNLGGDLVVEAPLTAGASLNGTIPPAGPPGSPSLPPAIRLNTNENGNLTLIGDMGFSGDVAMNNAFGTTTIQSGGLFHGANNITLTTNSYVQNGTPPQITANNFILNLTPLGTVINTNGDVTFNTNTTTINGSDFAIIASGTINLGNITLNLSNGSGDGGNLTLLAGVVFAPPTGVQQQTFDTFTFSSFGTGNVNAGSATINTSASGPSGDGGNVVAVASNGTVTISSINTSSANGEAGTVTIIGENGINVGSITSLDAGGGGAVALTVAEPSITGLPSVSNGTIAGGSFVSGALSAGPIESSIVSAGVIQMTTDGAGSTITLNAALNANQIFLNAGAGVVSTPVISALGAQEDSLGNGGTFFINAFNILGNLPLSFDVSGSVNGGTFVFTRSSTTGLTLGTANVSVDATGGTGNGGSVTFVTGGDLTVNAGGISGAGADDGASIELVAGESGTGILTLASKTFIEDAKGAGANGDGGFLRLSGSSIVFDNTAILPLILDVSGVGTGNGGTVVYEDRSTVNTVVGSVDKPPKQPINFLNIDARSGAAGGNGGAVDIITGGLLIVNPSDLLVGPLGTDGNGALISLQAGTNLVVSGGLGDLSALGVGTGTDGAIALKSNSKTVFSFDGGKTPKNGVFGSVQAGSVSITNSGGGIKVNTSDALQADELELAADLKGSITTGKNVVLTAIDEIALSASTGAIGKKPLLVSTPRLRATSVGIVKLINQFAGPSELLGSAAGKEFSLTTSSALLVNDITTTEGDITVIGGNGGALRVDNGATISAIDGELILQNPDINLGSIVIGDGATVQTQGPKGDNTTISIGVAPKKGTTTTVPSGVNTPTITGKGQAFFEGAPGSIVGVGPINANIQALGKTVMISNASVGGELIELGSNATIIADPPVSTATAGNAKVAPINLIGITALASPQALESASASAPAFASSLSQFGSTTALPSDLKGLVTLDEAEMNKSINPSPLSIFFDAAGGDTGYIADDLIVDAAFHSEDDFGFAADVSSTAPQLKNIGLLSDKRFSLKNNNVVFAPKCDTTIETAHGTVKIGANAVVLVMQSSDGLAVYDLDDHRKHSVVVESNGKRISLSPGQHAHISSHGSTDFADVNALELVQYRGLSRTRLENGWNVYTSEFSIPSACFAVKTLRQLTSSSHSAAARARAHMLKTTAVLMMLNPDRGDFTQFFKRRVTAMR